MVSTERFLEQQAERLSAAWRRIRKEQPGEEHSGQPMLDGVVEHFLRELAATLRGSEGSAWSRTRGVLRLSPGRGEASLNREFDALTLCLTTALGSLGSNLHERALIREQLRDARLSARALLRAMRGDSARPRVPFGGLVVERFEAGSSPPPARITPVH